MVLERDNPEIIPLILIQEKVQFQGRMIPFRPNEETLSKREVPLDDDHPFDEYINQVLISNHNIHHEYVIKEMTSNELENEKYVVSLFEKLLLKELNDYKDVFQIPKSLPLPSRGIWDFKLSITQEDLNSLSLAKA
ncbi:hypothetical protein H8356DRAFT_1396212 [Neocallimastix lanati (nom. inval.)]|nr:hypothetical protein H8356DRAFT_1396212 [Neocallimastix sp. JGI-2020a]